MDEAETKQLETLLLLSKFEEAAQQCELIVASSPGPDLAQNARFLAVFTQACFATGRMESLPESIKRIAGSTSKIPLVPFIYWVLLLIEHKQHNKARVCVEEYIRDNVCVQDQLCVNPQDLGKNGSGISEDQRTAYSLATLYAVELLSKHCKDVEGAKSWITQDALFLPSDQRQRLLQAVKEVQDEQQPSVSAGVSKRERRTSIASEIQPIDVSDITSPHLGGSTRGPRSPVRPRLSPREHLVTTPLPVAHPPPSFPATAYSAVKAALHPLYLQSLRTLTRQWRHLKHGPGLWAWQYLAQMKETVVILISKLGNKAHTWQVLWWLVVALALIAERRTVSMFIGKWRVMMGGVLGAIRRHTVTVLRTLWYTLWMAVTLAPSV